MLLYIILFVIFVGLLLFYNGQNYSVWRKRGIKYVPPVPFFGNMLPNFLKQCPFTDLLIRLYSAFPNERYMGIYQLNKPVLLIRDLDLIKQITIKDFNKFVDHGNFVDPHADVLWGKNLFASKGERWRELRQTLSPIFTSSKMKSMFVLMDSCAQRFVNYFKEKNVEILELELKDIFSRYTNDIIASIAFGIECDSLKHKNNEFFQMGLKVKEDSENKLVFLLHSTYPLIARMLNLRIFSEEVSNFFRNVVKETIHARETQGIVRPDLINLLLEARKGKLKYETENDDKDDTSFSIVRESLTSSFTRSSYPELTDDDITAQALVFFLGGYDTTSYFMSFVAYELAVNTDVQNKLRYEISETEEECGGKLNYGAITRMKYLDMVITETLRKWPQAVFLERICTSPCTIEPTQKGESVLEINIGDHIWMPAYAIQRDPKHYPNPDLFDPDRFSDENKNSIDPMSYLPFGTGPRSCIGNRFALLESKVLIYHILKSFELVPIKKTAVPFKLSLRTLTPSAADGFWIGFKALKS